MAAATHKCEYLMKLEEKLCKLIHQDWFSDPNEIPIKLQSLGNANVKLAHRPWEFSEKDIKNLLTHWNPKELVLALTILCQFHCLSSFIFATGVSAEPDLPINRLKEPAGPLIQSAKPKANIVNIMKNIYIFTYVWNYFIFFVFC